MLADVDDDTRLLLARLKLQQYIDGYEYQGEENQLEAVVYMNGNLVKLTSYAKKTASQVAKKGINRMADRLSKFIRPGTSVYQPS